MPPSRRCLQQICRMLIASVHGVLFIPDLFSYVLLHKFLSQPPHTPYENISHIDLHQCVNHALCTFSMKEIYPFLLDHVARAIPHAH